MSNNNLEEIKKHQHKWTRVEYLYKDGVQIGYLLACIGNGEYCSETKEEIKK